MVSSLTLRMGLCFFLGGVFNWRDATGRLSEQEFVTMGSQTGAIVEIFASVLLLLPSMVPLDQIRFSSAIILTHLTN